RGRTGGRAPRKATPRPGSRRGGLRKQGRPRRAPAARPARRRRPSAGPGRAGRHPRTGRPPAAPHCRHRVQDARLPRRGARRPRRSGQARAGGRGGTAQRSARSARRRAGRRRAVARLGPAGPREQGAREVAGTVGAYLAAGAAAVGGGARRRRSAGGFGARGRIDLDGVPGRPYLGKVVRIAPSLDPLTRTLEAEVQISNSSGELRPGMYGRASVVTAVHERAVTVPVQAVQISAGRRLAFVLQGDRVHRREVQIGVDGEDWLEIVRGLSPDEEVVVAGVEGLADNAQVRPARNTDPYSGGALSSDGADAGAPEGRRPAIPTRD